MLPMAKKPTYKQPTRDEQIAKAREDLNAFNSAPADAIPTPTRTFIVGEECRLGNLSDVHIIEVLMGGKGYIVEATRHERNGDCQVFLGQPWFKLDKLTNTTNAPKLMSRHRDFPARVSDLDSIIHLMAHGGLVCDPKYQRGYVWSEANKDALIESVFDRLDIGAFLIVSHAGYNHKGDRTQKSYVTLDGTPFTIAREDDYTNAIVDGQQRLTTLIDFIHNKRPYKGVYYSQLHPQDQREFTSHSVSWRTIDEDDTTEKEVIRMFLQSNRGVPQQPEHLAKIQALYNSMP
jgi:hypothetical protein